MTVGQYSKRVSEKKLLKAKARKDRRKVKEFPRRSCFKAKARKDRLKVKGFPRRSCLRRKHGRIGVK